MQKTAVITGGSKGIGKAICEKLLKNGFKVISVSRTSKNVQDLISNYPENFISLNYDFENKKEVLLCANEIQKLVSSIDILVNNAGVFIPGKTLEEEEGAYEKQMALNIGAPYYFTRSLVYLLEKVDLSYIFNICSTASITPYINGGSYCISKHALLGFTKVLRQECIEKRINVSAVLPGATLTDSWHGTDLPEERFIKPSNIADVIFAAWTIKDSACMEEILIRPIKGDL